MPRSISERAEFERAVGAALSQCGVDVSGRVRLGVAVSGGADSIALLTALRHLVPRTDALWVVTVDHNIRPAAESGGDAALVESYCARLGVRCERHTVPRGKIADMAHTRGGGIEEAARAVRYECFERFISSHSLSYLCLAHTWSDQLETLVMRFLSGGDVSALCGIPSVRGPYVRPLLALSRGQIEAYLLAQDIPYRTDQTNFDVRLLRNCIRAHIMPMLDTEVPGWRTALRSLAHKMREDDAVLEEIADDAVARAGWRTEAGEVSLDADAFARLPPAIRRRLVYRAVAVVGARSRVPYSFVARVCGKDCEAPWRDNAAGIEVVRGRSRLTVRQYRPAASEAGFFAIVTAAGGVPLPGWTLRARAEGGGMVLEAADGRGAGRRLVVPGMGFPFAIRSRQPGDAVRTADGSWRSVAAVLDGWKCGALRDQVPVVQELETAAQEIRGLWGGLWGFDDWIVRDKEGTE